jgi:hypothetical protein
MEPTNYPQPKSVSSEPARLPAVKAMNGNLSAWFETGTEGLIWIMEEDGHQGYASMRFPAKGDYLKVTAPNGNVLFDGIVDPDYDAGKKGRYPGDPSGQPTALGYWIHWTQRGWTPDDWAKLFLDEKNRAVLIKADSSIN